MTRNLRLPADLQLLWSGLALSLGFWGGMRAWREGDAVSAAGAVLAVAVGFLFLRRDPVREGALPGRVLPALPAVMAPPLVALAAHFGAPVFRLPELGLALAVAGCLFAAWALLVLGRSFAVLPARRQVVTRGPYAWVRHPAYLGELAAVLGLCLQGATLAALLLSAAAVVAVAVRIRAEERLLASDPAYSDYRGRVRRRLLPGVW